MKSPSPSPSRCVNRPIRLAVSSVFSTLLFLSVPALGQESEEDQTVYELTPFLVSTDRDSGYMTTNSTAGTSLNMLIRDIPLSLEVINREMLDDMQATNLEEALIYSAGVFTQNYVANSTATANFQDRSPSAVGSYGDPFQNNISIRGYNVPNQQRAGFRIGFIHNTARIVIGGSTDGITTERTEVVRGPQSLLYGINVLSGVTNIEPKRPLSELAGNTSLMFGNDNEFRATLDVTGPVIKNKLNFRVMAAHHEFDDPDQVDFRSYERDTLAIQFEYHITPRTQLFLEYVRSDRASRGIGPRHFSTTGNIRNIYGEAFRFGRDDPTVPLWVPNSPDGDVFDVYMQDHDMSKFGGSGPNGINDGPLIPNPAHEQYYDFSDRGYNFNLSGPDTYRNQREDNILAQLYHSFTKDLNLELGFYRSKVEIDQRNLVMNTFWNRTNEVEPELPNPIPILRRNWIDWQENPEVAAANGISDRIGIGIGELFTFGIRQLTQSTVNPSFFTVNYLPPLPATQVIDSDRNAERVYPYYWWFNKPESSESNQVRGRLAYTFETDFFDIPATHTLVGGFHYIEDTIQFISGNGTLRQFYSPGPVTPLRNPYSGKVASDPIIFRSSVFDTTPIRLRPDDVVVTAGNINYNRLGGLSPRPATGAGDPSAIARSGHRDDTLWFRGFYGIYRGQFWTDKLTLIGGIRHDSYQGKESEELVIIDRGRENYNWMGGVDLIHDPIRPGIYGDKPWEYNPRYSDQLNSAVASSIERLRFRRDANGEYTIPNMLNGTREHSFEESLTFTTKTAGLSYRLFEPLSVYVAYSEGVFPNVGTRDGAYRPVGPEETESKEIGFRFDLFDGKLSGTISFWQIERVNAVTAWAYAPHPAQFYGGPNEYANPSSDFMFSPLNTFKELTFEAVEGSPFEGGFLSRDNPADVAIASPYRGGNYWPLNYGIDVRYLELAMEQLGYPAPEYGNRVPVKEDFAQFNPNGEIIDMFDRGLNISTGAGEGSVKIVVIDYEKALRDADPETSVLKRAVELAREGAQVHGEPVPGGDVFSGPLRDYRGSGIIWYSFSDPPLNNPSATHFTDGDVNVTFQEKGDGVDGQLIYAPIPNWQIVFTFSHQERGLTGRGLNLVDPIGLDGQGGMKNWGTEYDVWVYLLGIENFEDPTRPSTYNGKSVRGVDLSFVPQESAGLLTRYTFRDTFLEGLTIGGGVQYEGEVITATTIGGARLEENEYLPPNRPDRFVFNTFLRYRWEMAGMTWSAQLNVNNLFDHVEDEVINNYVSDVDTPIVRRTLVRYTPRTWRLALSARF